ncbi:MAG: hypothetical protein Kow002_12080 [Anaerolineales bacterium]
MTKKRKLDREGLEVYLLNFLLAYRPLLFICGVFLLFYASGMFSKSFFGGITAVIPAFFLLLLCGSYKLTLGTARVGAWLLTLFKSS